MHHQSGPEFAHAGDYSAIRVRRFKEDTNAIELLKKYAQMLEFSELGRVPQWMSLATGLGDVGVAEVRVPLVCCRQVERKSV